MRRFLLLSANRDHFPEPIFPLGAAYAAAALRKSGAQVRIVEAGLSPFPLRFLRREIAAFRPDAVGLSLRNLDNAAYPRTRCYLPWHVTVVGAVRRATDAPVFLGGPAFSIEPEAVLALLQADGGVAGDGEEGIAGLPQAGDGDRPADSPAPVVRARLASLSDVGLPASIGEIFPQLGRYRTVGVQTARGCPHRCVYCTYPALEGGRVRPRPPEAVAEEIDFLHRAHRKRDFFLVDSCFNADETHMEAVCRAIASRRLPVRWSCYLEPKMSDPSLFRLLAEAGCVGVEFGADSGAESCLASLRKGFSAHDIVEASEACRRAGIDFCHSLLFGGPGETDETIRQTIRLMDETRPKAVVAMAGVRIYRGTEMERIALREGVLAPGTPLLGPRFYFAGGDPSRLLRRVYEAASRRRHWFLPGARDWSAHPGPPLLRLFHRAGGPMWRIFRGPPAS